MTVGKGLAWGIFLWLLMGVTWLPFPGWGQFGSVSPGVAVATLLLHGVYGAVLGWRLIGSGALSAMRACSHRPVGIALRPSIAHRGDE